MTGFDISKLTQDNAIAEVTFKVGVVKDDDGNDVSGFVIVGKNSQQYQDISKLLRKEGIQQASKRSSAIDASTDDGAAKLIDKLATNETRIAKAIIVDWFGFNQNGTELPFNEDIVSMMLDKMPYWQTLVLSALEKDANFMKG